MHYFYLAIAIMTEVIATSALKASHAMTILWPSVITILGYSIAIYFLSLSLNVIPVGIAYAIWSGIGIVLVTLIAAVLYKQLPDIAALIGIAMIIGGVIVIQIFSK